MTDDIVSRLRDERDEARRMYCWEMWEHSDPRDVANDLGWDCFKENTNG